MVACGTAPDGRHEIALPMSAGNGRVSYDGNLVKIEDVPGRLVCRCGETTIANGGNIWPAADRPLDAWPPGTVFTFGDPANRSTLVKDAAGKWTGTFPDGTQAEVMPGFPEWMHANNHLTATPA